MSWNLNIEDTCLDKIYTYDPDTLVTIQREEYRDMIREITELREKLKAEHTDFISMYGETKELREKITMLEGELEYWEEHATNSCDPDTLVERRELKEVE